MDDFEKLLQQYRPSRPPAGLRGRIVESASHERLAERPGRAREWLPVAAAAIVAMLFSWMAANERQRIATHVPPPPNEIVMNGSMEQ